MACMKVLMLYSTRDISLGLNFGIHFSRFLGNLCCSPGMKTASYLTMACSANHALVFLLKKMDQNMFFSLRIPQMVMKMRHEVQVVSHQIVCWFVDSLEYDSSIRTMGWFVFQKLIPILLCLSFQYQRVNYQSKQLVIRNF